MNDTRLVVVTGATGRQGGAVARHLLAAGWRVRALTRDPSSPASGRLASAGAEVVRADMASPDSLRPAFAGAHGVFSVQNPMISGLDEEVRQGRAVGDAAASAGVRHVVYASAGPGIPETGVRQWDNKLVVRAHLESLGLPLTVLRPMAFMELMTDKDFYPPVSMWHLMPKLIGDDRPLPWLCADDVGAVAARVFADPNKFAGVELPLGADVRTIGECRELWREVSGRPPRGFPMPLWLFHRFVGDDLTRMWRWLRTHPVAFDLAETRAIAPSARTVREWLVQRTYS
ncbi:NmrA/HSCARG family protein [Lentzea sp. BCCO 10_0856]|uniref:NmrA/HSCARG family protein n=1 Tax=Lentzea miocenica TaxID=3095431 RepID=A0ABU4SWH6_9PSEU|nr:NmrA/HSCARG family protein [Lentzea sp. BCCO 10_0856]MDX8030251.1 NmrA/HSCARG family protein [Lentzea sp. BCCO 10_0856]